MSNILQIDELKLVSKQGSTLLDCSNLCLRAGDIHAIIGASGAGKSLLAHAILGILPDEIISKSKILYQNRQLTKDLLKKIRGRELRLIPQLANYIDPSMKVATTIGKYSDSDSVLLKRLGIDKYLHYYRYQLSGGMAKKLLLATAIINNPCLIIADEPTIGLDYDMAKEIITILKDLSKSGKSVLLITHDLSLALDFADTFTIISEGKNIETTRESLEVFRNRFI